MFSLSKSFSSTSRVLIVVINFICPLDPSLSEPAATHPNPSHSPVVSLQDPFRAHSLLLFILYNTPLGLSHLIESSSVDHHLYVDETKLFISSPATFFHLNRTATLYGKPLSLNRCHPTSSASTLPKENSS